MNKENTWNADYFFQKKFLYSYIPAKLWHHNNVDPEKAHYDAAGISDTSAADSHLPQLCVKWILAGSIKFTEIVFIGKIVTDSTTKIKVECREELRRDNSSKKNINWVDDSTIK